MISAMRLQERGVQTVLSLAGSFAAFILMAVAVGTDYWLYSRGMCRTRASSDNETVKRNDEILTHSGLWRMCCMEGALKDVCKTIDHFDDDSDPKDMAEYLLRIMRASSVFPILSVLLLFMGSCCITAGEMNRAWHNVALGAGIAMVAAGLSNIIGIIVYISSNSGDPNLSDPANKQYSYGWSFYFAALSFFIAESLGAWLVHVFMGAQPHGRAGGGVDSGCGGGPIGVRLPSYRWRSHESSPVAFKPLNALTSTDTLAMYPLAQDSPPDFNLFAAPSGMGSSPPEIFALQNCARNELDETLFGLTSLNRRTTPV
uniref:voltage-dependent calcium channel gamma-2 subunit-like isoform X2 n=1 Tax=Myxine glutinosa TaxID=7769 RepID=UPI00358F05BC